MKKPLVLLAALVLEIAGNCAGQGVSSLSYEDAREIVRAMDEVVPPELKGKSPETQAGIWPNWLAGLNSQIRKRLLQGDEDTLINFLLFGASYTRQPRLGPADFKPAEKQPPADPKSPWSLFPSRTRQILGARMEDFIRALADSKSNERLLFFRSLVVQKGFPPGGAAESARIQNYLEMSLIRVLKESAEIASSLEAARKLGDASAEFAERSTLFRERGLSLDTSLPPDFALEESLVELKEKKLVGPGSVRRVAIIGPGLDFIDKDAGYDFYPPQILQPFAVIDSLVRLGLARPESVDLTTLDVSPRIIEHLQRARQRAVQGNPYTVQLTRSVPVAWSPGYLRFWENFGNQLGRPAPAPTQAIAPSEAILRAVSIRPDVVLRIHPMDLNIVTQHMTLPAAERFDLIIATNIFVYYDVFPQSLALANVGKMLRPGGLLLSNNALLELPFSPIHSIGYKTVAYSNRPSDGDTIVWYLRAK